MQVRLQQPVQVHYDVLHLRIINRPLGLVAPGFFGFGIALKNADYVQIGDVDEFDALRIGYTATHDEVEKLGHRLAFMHVERWRGL